MSDQSAEVVEFSKFYMENVPRLIAFLVCQGFSVIDAADCVQETLIDALPPVWPPSSTPMRGVGSSRTGKPASCPSDDEKRCSRIPNWPDHRSSRPASTWRTSKQTTSSCAGWLC